MKNRNVIPPPGGPPPALDVEKIRHDVSTAVGLIDSAYEELKENPAVPQNLWVEPVYRVA